MSRICHAKLLSHQLVSYSCDSHHLLQNGSLTYYVQPTPTRGSRTESMGDCIKILCIRYYAYFDLIS